MCCAKCFSDHWLSAYIERKSNGVDVCPHCGALADVVEPTDLTEEFEALLEAYTVRAGGQPLAELLNQDWQLFAIGTEPSGRLLREILGEAGSLRYGPRRNQDADTAAKRWSDFRIELKSTNRFFPENAPDRDEFTNLIGHLMAHDTPRSLHRARAFKNEERFELRDLCAPPADFASDGRANPIGIPYLYLASDVKTAVSEVRPAKGGRVAVAEFTLREGGSPKLIDLSNPRGTISPFAVGAENIGDVRGAMDFLCLLGEELSTPTSPHRASIDYLASQYLCELIKSIGYNGVIYKSSLTTGQNYAIFNPDTYTPSGEIITFIITNIAVDFERM